MLPAAYIHCSQRASMHGWAFDAAPCKQACARRSVCIRRRRWSATTHVLHPRLSDSTIVEFEVPWQVHDIVPFPPFRCCSDPCRPAVPVAVAPPPCCPRRRATLLVLLLPTPFLFLSLLLFAAPVRGRCCPAAWATCCGPPSTSRRPASLPSGRWGVGVCTAEPSAAPSAAAAAGVSAAHGKCHGKTACRNGGDPVVIK